MEQSNDNEHPLYESDFKGIAFTELRIDEDDINEKSVRHANSAIIQPDYVPVEATTTDQSTNVREAAAQSKRASADSNATALNNDDAKAKSSFAFTIDFNDGKSVDNKRQREISERIQLRQRQHRRGVSLSKLDDTVGSLPSSASVDDVHCLANGGKPPLRERQMALKNGRRQQSASSVDHDQADAVVLRRRPQRSDAADVGNNNSNSNSNNNNKRHSWSPRTSVRDEVQQQQQQPSLKQQQHQQRPHNRASNNVSSSSFFPKSSILQKALEGQQRSANQTKTTSEMKLGVVTAPLEYVRLSDDAVSETGTYTLDGDHYTEEEKARMSIDKDNLKVQRYSVDLRVNSIGGQGPDKSRATAETVTPSQLTNPSKRTIAATKKESYMDKIKFGVKAFGDSKFNKLPLGRNGRASSEIPISTASNISDDKDVGTFTSVTSCGVLNRAITMDAKQPQHRKNHLTKLLIDASEYIQPSCRIGTDNMMRSYTDYEKAKQNQYQLNIFSTASSTSQIDADSYEQLEEAADATETSISLKTAPTKNDWIKEWARNARRRNILLSTANGTDKPTNSPQKSSSSLHPKSFRGNNNIEHYGQTVGHSSNEFGDDVNSDYEEHVELRHPNNPTKAANAYDTHRSGTAAARPPVSPTKIPSPMHSAFRARGNSATRSFRSSNPRIDNLDTEMYLEKTAEAISYLKKLHRNNASSNGVNRQSTPRNCTSPSHYTNNYNYEPTHRQISAHKRNLSLDGTSTINFDKLTYGQSFDSKNELMHSYEQLRHRGHVRSNSYENKHSNPDTIGAAQQRHKIDQTSPSQRRMQVAEQQKHAATGSHEAGYGHSHSHSKGLPLTGSPMRRSTSFSVQKRNNNSSPSPKVQSAASGIMKSTSSSSFKKLSLTATSLGGYHGGNVDGDYDDDDIDDDYSGGADKYYAHDASDDINSNECVNDRDRDALYLSDGMHDRSSGYDDSMSHSYQKQHGSSVHSTEAPISHTRYNKAFLMRVEQSKQFAVSGGGPIPAKGLMACPNTPEMPRRNVAQRASFHDRKSMPRDSSLSRIKQDLPNLKTMKKSLTESGASVTPSLASSIASTKSQGKVLPKYLDISKYKSNTGHGQTFLRRDESKSTLINKMDIKKSPSAIGLMRMDNLAGIGHIATANTGRVKSAGAKLGGSSAKANRGRETELAMWRRRSTYDPMKAAAEGKKKQEGNKKTISKSGDSSSIWRSQSFHGGVGQSGDCQLSTKFNGHRYACDMSKAESLLSSGDDDDDNGEFFESS